MEVMNALLATHDEFRGTQYFTLHASLITNQRKCINFILGSPVL